MVLGTDSTLAGAAVFGYGEAPAPCAAVGETCAGFEGGYATGILPPAELAASFGNNPFQNSSLSNMLRSLSHGHHLISQILLLALVPAQSCSNSCGIRITDSNTSLRTHAHNATSTARQRHPLYPHAPPVQSNELAYLHNSQTYPQR